MADDTYLGIAYIAKNEFMIERMDACATQQWHLGTIEIGEEWGTGPTAPRSWVINNQYLWASSPGWGAAWESALAGHSDDPEYDPGKDPAVITDGMILATVQALAPKPEPTPEPKEEGA